MRTGPAAGAQRFSQALEEQRVTAAARAAERAGAIEPFRDAALYDWEYRRRRHDIAFYRMLAAERGGPILDLGCGTGRILAPLRHDGFDVIGIDLSASMLARAQRRLRVRDRNQGSAGLLVRGDLRALPVRGTFPLVIMAFHTIQHFIEDDELLGVLGAIRRLLGGDGWFAFDVFAPSPRWLARPANRRFDPVLFRHPTTGRRMQYSVSHRLDTERRALHMRFHYRPVGVANAVARRGATVRLCHRQLAPAEVEALLARAGLRLIGRWGGFHDEPLGDGTGTEQHVYLARTGR